MSSDAPLPNAPEDDPSYYWSRRAPEVIPDYDARFYPKYDQRRRIGKTPLAPQLQPLRDALDDKKPPYCAGVLPVRNDNLILYYGKDGLDSSRIDFLRASEEELQRLSSTCDPATFGLNQKDVLDETYRKAGKLDSAYFATKLDVISSGLMEAVRFDLLPGHQCQRQIGAELYKLNVYGRSFWRHYAVVGAVNCMCSNLLAKFTYIGESSFFKAHKDTPRGPTMFGSLVVILPAPHEGGALLLRHGGAEWTFDSAQAVSEHSIENPLIAYAAFFSDVEHEVTTVSSGHRVTITYNLYFDDDDDGTDSNALVIKTLPPTESSFVSAFKALLNDKSFLPHGGYVGFGLHHEYPTETQPSRIMTLNHLKKCLKGSDAVVFKVCQELGLDVQVNLFFKEDEYGLLLDHEPDMREIVCHEDALWHILKQDENAKIVEQYNKERSYRKNKPIDMEVLWATKRTPFNQLKATYGAYGNEVMTDYVYGQFCIIVHVGPAGSRSTVQGAA